MIVPIATTTNLWQHQTQAIEYMLSRKSALLQMGVATGKTLTTLEFIQHKQFKLTLIVGTKNSCDTWQKQSKDFGYAFNVHVFRDGLVRDRAKQLQSVLSHLQAPTIIVVNYEGMIRKSMLDTLLKLPLECIVFDEVHRLRGQKTKQSKTALLLAKAHPRAYRIGLTGTLIYNHPLDVFGIFRFIDPSIFGTRWTDFKETYAVWTGQFNQIPVRYTNQEQLKNLVANNSFIVDRHAVLDLPSEQHVNIEVQLDRKEQAVYNEFNREYVATLNESTISAKNVLDKVNKLQQLTGGFIYSDTVIPFSNAKANALSELLEGTDENVVVFYKYKAELEILRQVSKTASLPFYSISGNGSDYRTWLACPVQSLLAVQISSGSEGIDFTKASVTIFYDMIYTWGQYEQALGRTSRPNQTSDHLLYYYLACRNTIDEEIIEALKAKKDLIDFITSARKT